MDGTSLGGWMVMEAWLFPNVLLVQGVTPDVNPAIKGNQELDYITRMRAVDIDAVASMHNLWNTYVVEDLLGPNPDISRLIAMKAAGVNTIRIPVGWWIMEPPVEVPSEYKHHHLHNYTHRDKGFTKNGFVSGGIVYVEKMLKILKKLGMRAYSESFFIYCFFC